MSPRTPKPARLAMLLERVLIGVPKWQTRRREYIARCIEELRSGKRDGVPGDLFRDALTEINECAVVGCGKTALYRYGTAGFCRDHRGIASLAVKRQGHELSRAADARAAAATDDGREAARDLSGPKRERFAPPRMAGKPQRIRTEPGLDVLGLQAMVARRRRNSR